MREHAKAVREAGHRVVVLHLAGARHGARPKHLVDGGGARSVAVRRDRAHHVHHRRSRVPGASYAFSCRARSAPTAASRRRVPPRRHPRARLRGRSYAAIVAGGPDPPVITEHFSGSRSGRSWPRRVAESALRVQPRRPHLAGIAVSPGRHQELRHRRPFEVFPNVVDSSFLPARRTQKPADRRLLFVGNLEPLAHYKGFPTLLEALFAS